MVRVSEEFELSEFELSRFYCIYDLRLVGYNLTSFLKSEQKIIC